MSEKRAPWRLLAGLHRRRGEAVEADDVDGRDIRHSIEILVDSSDRDVDPLANRSFVAVGDG